MEEEIDWTKSSSEEKKRKLFEKQKATLDAFLARNAIDQAQYDTSLNGLILSAVSAVL